MTGRDIGDPPPAGVLLHLHPDDVEALGGVRRAASKVHDLIRERARTKGAPGATSVMWLDPASGQVNAEVAEPPSVISYPTGCPDPVGAIAAALALDWTRQANAARLGLAVLAAVDGVPAEHLESLAELTTDTRGGLPLSSSEVIARQVARHLLVWGQDRNELGDSDATVHVLVGFDGDDDRPYFYEASPGDAEGNDSCYEADVPAVLTAWCDLAGTAHNAAYQAVLDATGLQLAEARRGRCCRAYVGERTPSHAASWVVAVPAHPTGEEWPAGGRSVAITWGFDTEQAAIDARAALPEVVYVAGYGPMPQRVDRDHLVVEEQPGWPGYWPRCDYCGWERDDHEIRAVSPEGGTVTELWVPPPSTTDAPDPAAVTREDAMTQALREEPSPVTEDTPNAHLIDRGMRDVDGAPVVVGCVVDKATGNVKPAYRGGKVVMLDTDGTVQVRWPGVPENSAAVFYEPGDLLVVASPR